MQIKKSLTEPDPIIQKALEVLKIEADGIMNLLERVDHNFVEMVDVICASSARVIISGIGKSGIIGRKIVATLNSTGTRSLFHTHMTRGTVSGALWRSSMASTMGMLSSAA